MQKWLISTHLRKMVRDLNIATKYEQFSRYILCTSKKKTISGYRQSILYTFNNYFIYINCLILYQQNFVDEISTKIW